MTSKVGPRTERIKIFIMAVTLAVTGFWPGSYWLLALQLLALALQLLAFGLAVTGF